MSGEDKDNGQQPRAIADLRLVIFEDGNVALTGAHPDPLVTIELLTRGTAEICKQLVTMAARGELEGQRIIRPGAVQ